jgi:hypothetical protein
MALDSRTKRKSVMAMGMSFLLQPSAPDGTNLGAQAERKTFLGLSSAIDSTAVAPPPSDSYGNARRRFLRFLGRR